MERAPDAGRIQAYIRGKNDEIAGMARDLGFAHDQLLPFLCECPNLNCAQLVRLSLNEYRTVRDSPRRYIGVPGHETAPGEQIAEVGGRFVVTQK